MMKMALSAADDETGIERSRCSFCKYMYISKKTLLKPGRPDTCRSVKTPGDQIHVYQLKSYSSPGDQIHVYQ